MSPAANLPLEFSERMPAGVRVFIGLSGLFPWLAPYELLFRYGWRGFNLVFVLGLLISLGAIAVSVIFWLVALLGLNRRTVFDFQHRTITDGSSNVLMRYREKQYTFREVTGFKVITHDWSEGPSTYELAMQLKNGAEIKFGKFAKQKEAEEAQANLALHVLGI
jgi:hypothetical protein